MACHAAQVTRLSPRVTGRFRGPRPGFLCQAACRRDRGRLVTRLSRDQGRGLPRRRVGVAAGRVCGPGGARRAGECKA